MNERPFFINISSIVARHPHEFSTVYAATKAYMSNLIQGVSQENKKQVFLNVEPWFVKTKMVNYQKTWDSAAPEEVVKGAFKVLGKRLHCSGCIRHQLIDSFSWLFSSHFEARGQESIKSKETIVTNVKSSQKEMIFMSVYLVYNHVEFVPVGGLPQNNQ